MEKPPVFGHILIVDDNEMNRDLLARRLARLGYSLKTVESGKEALELLAKQQFDLVLCDIMMPEISGLEVLETIRKTHSLADLPVIMVTAKHQSEDVVESLKLGANDYVTKPIDFPVLFARVRTQLQLRQLAALKDEFLNIASHDLKNPLTEVLGIASLVEMMVPPGTPMPDKIFSMVVNLKKSARKMQYIIEDFLEFQAMQDGELRLRPESVDLGALIREVIEANHSYAEKKGIGLTLAPLPASRANEADPLRLTQVIQNLVDNALKFSPSGSSVTVRLEDQGENLLVEVTDSGPGLTPEDLANAFVKYSKLSNTPTGGEKSSGLGLAICKQLIDLHGGAIGARNNPGGGATFWFSVPRVAAAAPAGSTGQPS